MKTRLFLLFILIGISVTACSSKQMRTQEHRPFSEMKGGCENYALDLKRDLSLWDESVVTLPANLETKPLPMERRVELELGSQAETEFLIKPEKTFDMESPAFAGVIKFAPPESGVYRISMGERVWLDVIELQTMKSVQANRFEMQTKCPKIFKTVEFVLDSGKEYALQISSSPKKNAQVLVLKVNP